MTRQRMYGSASIIIIVVVVLALLGGIGYVLWTKLNAISTGADGHSNQTAKKPSNYKSASFDKSFGIAMSFKYPKSWTIDKKNEGAFPVSAKSISFETFTVTSPDKKYTVVYKLRSGDGLGGMCDEQNSPTIVAVEGEDVKGWKGAKLVSSITKTPAGKYISQVGLVSPIYLMHVKIGGSGCQFSTGVLNVPSMTLELNLVDASIHGNIGANMIDGTSDQGVQTEKDARQLFSGKSFEEAKSILLSTTLK